MLNEKFPQQAAFGSREKCVGLDFTLRGRQRTSVGCGASGSRVCQLVLAGADLVLI